MNDAATILHQNSYDFVSMWSFFIKVYFSSWTSAR